MAKVLPAPKANAIYPNELNQGTIASLFYHNGTLGASKKEAPMSVAKMKDGKRWYVFVRYTDWTGQVKQHKKEGFERRADAKEYEKNFLEQKNGSPDMTVKSLYTLYMEDSKPLTHHICK